MIDLASNNSLIFWLLIFGIVAISIVFGYMICSLTRADQEERIEAKQRLFESLTSPE